MSLPAPPLDDDSDIDTEDRMALTDMRVFWGADIARLEYLLFLIHTGRIKDDAATRRIA